MTGLRDTDAIQPHVVTVDDVDDAGFLLQAIDLAEQARASGDHPFGAVLVGRSGTVVGSGLNTVVTDRDPTGHAETNLVRTVGGRISRADLSTMTMYASTEPCAMCAGAIYWAGIGAVVYALAESELRELAGADPANPVLDLPCREVFARGVREIEVRGPVDLPKAREVHAGFWSP